jgi:hypothetical protein
MCRSWDTCTKSRFVAKHRTSQVSGTFSLAYGLKERKHIDFRQAAFIATHMQKSKKLTTGYPAVSEKP